MIELSRERIEQLLHEEAVKKEEPDTILRSIYTRYMHLFEAYYADIDALKEEKVAGFRAYHEETKSLVKYYYMDIPQDICEGIQAFEKECTEKLLGPEWQKSLSGRYKEFKEKNENQKKGEEALKADFTKQSLSDFYEAMDYVFREGFGTGSKAAKGFLDTIKMLFGGEKQHAG